MNLFIVSKRAAKLLFLFVGILWLSACGDSTKDHFKLSGSTMGTTYHITVLERDGGATNQAELQQAIDQQLALINQQMSTYSTNSELSRLNAAQVDQWVKLSPNLFEVLMLSLELGWLSNGAFDITVGPLVDLWGFGPGHEGSPDKVPANKKIESLKSQLGFQHLEFDLEAQSARKRRDIRLDLSAIAKGYGVDKIAALLEYAGYQHFMVEIGGELRLSGHSPRGEPWRIAIEKPGRNSFGQVHAAVNISKGGMATSGDYRNYFEQDGKRYSHTLDPTTGYPIKHHLVSVTVIADTAAYADGLATALNVLGPERGMALAEQQGLAVYMITKTDQGLVVSMSQAFEPYIGQ